MRQALLLVPLLAVACSYPRFSASKVVETEVPASQIRLLHCETHNGDITIMTGQSADTVMLRTEMKVRGHTQEEADDNLLMMSVVSETDGDELHIHGQYPRRMLRNRSPRFSFTMQVPAQLALKLESHNGDIETSGTNGALSIETHNGDIEGNVGNTEVNVETHNGDIEIGIESAGALAGSITSHNGNVRVALDEGANGQLIARTHNGRISPPKRLRDAKIKRRSLRCRVGEVNSDGKLYIETHNGNVNIRSGRVDYR